MERNGNGGRAWFGLILALVVVAMGGRALAQNQDWRRLADRHEPFVGPIFRAGDPEPLGVGRAGFDSDGVVLMSWFPLSAFPGGNQLGSDCWGYVSPSGREYAIIGLERGYGFVEVTDPASAQIIAFMPSVTSLWHDIKVLGDRAYGVSEGGGGIQVFDLSRIDQGIVTHVTDVFQMGHSSTHNIAANPDSGFLYLCGANSPTSGLVAVSTADPDNPRIVGSWNGNTVHDAQIVTYTDGPMAGREIAYCFNGGAGIEVIDVTDKSNMVKIGGTAYPGLRFSHQGWLSADRRYLYTNDELDEGSTVFVTTSRVFDVLDPRNPTFVGTFTSGSAAIDHNMYVNGDFIYEANYRSGLQVFDATNPTSPVLVGFFDTFPGSDSPGFDGAWSVYPFFPSGTVVVSDLERGLFVLDVLVDGPRQRLLFDFPLGTPATVPPGQTTPITVQITQEGVTLDPASVLLNVSVDGGSATLVPMAPSGVEQFTGDLPAADCFSNVSFFVAAQTTAGQVFTSTSFSADVLTGQTELVADDFEIDTGWSVQDIDLATGSWQRGIPAGAGDRGDPTADFDGSGKAWLTGNAPGDSDVDGGPTRLISPTFDLGGRDHVVVSYARWFTNDDGDGDRLDVHVSNDGGATWTLVESVQGGGGWTLAGFMLDDFLMPTSQVRVRFSATDNPNDSVTEGGIDDFHIVVLECDQPSCPADLTGDGTVDASDFFAFVEAFAAGDPAADIDGSGSVDVGDFFAFVTAFDAGCP